MKKFYDEPIIEVILMDAQDIITGSNELEGNTVEVPYDQL